MAGGLSPMTPHWLPARTGTKPDGADRRRSLSFDGQGGEAGVAAAARWQFLRLGVSASLRYIRGGFNAKTQGRKDAIRIRRWPGSDQASGNDEDL
jgi:hypothetical protein